VPIAADCILAIDQGSSSTRCTAFDEELQTLATSSRPVSTNRPGPGMVEHDPGELLAGVFEVVAEAGRAVGDSVAAVAIANQTETFVLWERESGEAVTPVVSWQDQRATGVCAALEGTPGADRVAGVTGLALDPTFSAPKLRWLFDADPGLERRAVGGELLFGDVACWLAYHLSGRAGHLTEPSNACRTLLVDLAALEWDAGLLDLFGVPSALLPAIRPSDASGLRTAGSVTGFEVPVAAMLGDQQGALYGQGCTRPRMAALTLGTGAFLWLNAGAAPATAPAGVLSTAAWQAGGDGATYALEAFGANAGNALGVLRGQGLAPAEGDTPALDWGRPRPVIVPAPAGLGTPHWHGADRITVLGAGSQTSAADLAIAGLVGVAQQIADALEAMDVRARADVIRVGGGLAANQALVQAVADLSGVTLALSEVREATARGAAAMAGAAIGTVAPGAEPQVTRLVEPQLDERGRARERDRWREAVAVHTRWEDDR
jgi:glycerol kinase